MLDEQPLIRTATKDDIDSMLALLQQLFAIEADFEFDPARARHGLELLLVQPEQARVLVAEYQRNIIGMCTLQLLISTAEGGLVGLLEDVVVDAHWRGKGIGGSLLQVMTQWSVARGVQRLQLLADRHNRAALGFYTASGWSTTELIALRRRLDTPRPA